MASAFIYREIENINVVEGKKWFGTTQGGESCRKMEEGRKRRRGDEKKVEIEERMKGGKDEGRKG